MKNIYFFTFFVFYLIYATVSFSQNDTAYTNNKYKFKITYPKDGYFTYEDCDSILNCNILLLNYDPLKIRFIFISAFLSDSKDSDIFYLRDTLLLISLIKQLITEILKINIDYIVKENLKDIPAVYFRGTDNNNNKPYYSYGYITNHNSVFYFLIGSTNNNNYLQDDELYFKKFFKSNFFFL